MHNQYKGNHMNMSPNQSLYPYPANLVIQYKLSDDTIILIRPIRHDDDEIIREFSRHLSSELKHLNYMENFKELPQKMVTRLTQVDYKKSMTIIATYLENEKETVIGMVHYITEDEKNCEFDIIITDAWQNKNIGTVLTEALIKSAKDNGIKSAKIVILASNLGGMMLAKNFGFVVKDSDDPTIKVVTKNLY